MRRLALVLLLTGCGDAFGGGSAASTTGGAGGEGGSPGGAAGSTGDGGASTDPGSGGSAGDDAEGGAGGESIPTGGAGGSTTGEGGQPEADAGVEAGESDAAAKDAASDAPCVPSVSCEELPAGACGPVDTGCGIVDCLCGIAGDVPGQTSPLGCIGGQCTCGDASSYGAAVAACDGKGAPSWCEAHEDTPLGCFPVDVDDPFIWCCK